VIFKWGGLPPLDFIAKLAALMPLPRTNMTRFHGWWSETRLPNPKAIFGCVSHC
jgi:hypothetical protein